MIIIEIDTDNPEAGERAVRAAKHLCHQIGVDTDTACRMYDAEVYVWDKDRGEPLWGSSYDGTDNNAASIDNDPVNGDKQGGCITATGPAWEYIYGLLEELVKKRITVTLNGHIELELRYIDDPFAYPSSTSVVAGSGWNGDDWDGASITVPLFFPPEHPQAGECFIHTIHIH